MIVVLKLISWFLRNFTSYSATALPGLILEKYSPNTIRGLFAQLDEVVVITGTNGKTSTAKMLGHLLRSNKLPYIHNSSGSNLIRGVTSTLLDQSNWAGKLKSNRAILEVEEATLPRLVNLVKPKIIIVTNIFRDQLDAYGEVDKTFEYISSGIKDSGNPVLILNADDSRVNKLASLTRNKVSLIGFAEQYRRFIKLENRDRERVRVKPDYLIKNIVTEESLSSRYDLEIIGKTIAGLFVPIPGLPQCFNFTAALLAFSSMMGKSLDEVLEKYDTDISKMSPAFGRGEILKVDESRFQVFLAKNPAGMNLNLHLLSFAPKRDNLLLILNDKIADGRDVSWIWDCDFGLLKNLGFKKIYVSGTRCWDMALRIKYEPFAGAQGKDLEVVPEIKDVIKKITNSNSGKTYVLPTYTAMLEFRREIGKLTNVSKIHE